MQHCHEDVTLECYLLPTTVSPGLGCLLGTYRIQTWSKLRNRLRTITTLVHRRPKVGNYVSSCCTCTHYYYTVYLKYLNMNTQEQQMFDYTKWNCSPGRPEWLRLVLSCHSLGFLLSLLCRAMHGCLLYGVWKASRCDLRSPKSHQFSALSMDNGLLGRWVSLIAGLKHDIDYGIFV